MANDNESLSTAVGASVATILVGVACFGFSFLPNGCSANSAAIRAYSKPHNIKQFSGGKLIGEWTSAGKVAKVDKGDGFYFEDAATGRLTEVAGDVQITVDK